MEDIISVCVYKKFTDLTGENQKKNIFDPEHAATNAGKVFY